MSTYKVKVKFVTIGTYEVSGWRKGWIFWHRICCERLTNFAAAAARAKALGKGYQKIPGAKVIYD
jgi:hypothetical protein